MKGPTIICTSFGQLNERRNGEWALLCTKTDLQAPKRSFNGCPKDIFRAPLRAPSRVVRPLFWGREVHVLQRFGEQEREETGPCVRERA